MRYIDALRAQVEHMGLALAATLPSLAIALIVLLLTWVVARFAARISDLLVGRRDVRASLKRLLDSLVRAAIWLCGLMLAAMMVLPGLTPAATLAGLGIGALALGIAFRDIFENYLAGVLILVRKKMQVGDIIACGGIVGKLDYMGLRESHIDAPTGETIIVPNAILFKSPITILTDKELRRFELEIDLPRDADLDRAAGVMRRAMTRLAGGAAACPPEVHACSFSGADVTFVVRWWGAASLKNEAESRDRIIRGISLALSDAGFRTSAPIPVEPAVPAARPAMRNGRTVA